MKTVFVIAAGVLGVGCCFALAVGILEWVSGGNDLLMGLIGLGAVPLGMMAGLALGVWGALRVDTISSTHRGRRRATFLGGLALACVALFALMRFLGSPPSDERLIANFERNEQTFNRLVEMSRSDPRLLRVDQDWTIPRDPSTIRVPPERLALYRSLLRRVGTPRGFQVYGQGDMVFFFWLKGSAISSDMDKGYAFLSSPPTSDMASLNEYPLHKPGIAYRHISGNWYIFYEFISG